jgi:hypothetical protein
MEQQDLNKRLSAYKFVIAGLLLCVFVLALMLFISKNELGKSVDNYEKGYKDCTAKINELQLPEGVITSPNSVNIVVNVT